MTSLQKLKDYRDHPALSQSELKAILSGKSYTKKPSLTMLIGSYVDTMITCPPLKDDLYYVADVSRPTDKIVELCESFYNWLSQAIDDGSEPYYSNLEKHKDEIEHWLEFQPYYSNRPKTRVDKFIKEAAEWWTVLVQKGDRQIITSMEELEADLIIIRLVNDSSLDWVWNAAFQKDFYWTEEGVDCKGLGDIYLDEVYIDIKYTTCPNLNEWMKVCANLNYPFQMAFYKSGLGFKKGYWLVVSKDWHQLIPVSDLMFNIGKHGYRKKEIIRTGDMEFNVIKKVPGYLDGLTLLKGEKEKTIEQLYLEQL